MINITEFLKHIFYYFPNNFDDNKNFINLTTYTNMKKSLIIGGILTLALNLQAQPPADNTPTYPSGATYQLTDGSTVTKTGETLSSSTQYYNVVQVTNGTLNLENCTITKTGDGSSGDNSSFYGNNSTIYAGSASESGYSSTSSATNAVINISGCSITTTSKGANAVFATNGATIYASDITIDNSYAVSRGLHCTYGGKIVATDVDITTRSETSSTIATDRGSGTVTVTGGTATAKGNNSAVLYSTGTITATDLTGVSEQGEIAVVEGDNGVIIDGCNMTSGSSNRGLMMLQSGSGDAEGSNAYITVSNSTLTVTDSSVPLCEVPTENNGTLTLTDVTLAVASGILMYVDYNTQWSTYGGYGNLVLATTQDSWTYVGTADADAYSNLTVKVGENVVWNGAVDTDNNAKSATVTVQSGAVWVLTADSYVSSLVNNGTIITNGYTLTATSKSGSGTISTTGNISLTIGSMGWYTIYSPAALDFSEVDGITAYTAAFGDSEAILSEVSQVPANTAVILKGDAGTYSIPTVLSASEVSGNDLLGSLKGKIATSSTNCYALAEVDDSTVGFVLVEAGVGIPAGKAYFETTSSSACSYYTFSEATGIENVENSIGKTKESIIYDIQGRRVSSPNKGIYVKEGKLYINK